MNAAELFAIIIVAVFALDGLRVGLVKSVFRIVKLMIGMLIASIVCSPLIQVIPEQVRYIIPLSFISIIFTVFGIIGLVERLINLVDMIPVAREINRIAGLPAGLIFGVMVVWVMITAAAYFADTSWGALACELIKESSALMWLSQINPMQCIIDKWYEAFPIPEIPDKIC